MERLQTVFGKIKSQFISDAENINFRGIALVSDGSKYLAVDRSNNPVVLIATDPPGPGIAPMSVRLENIEADFGRLCVIERPGGELVRDSFFVLTCKASDVELQAHYFLIMDGVLKNLPTKPKVSDLTRIVSNLIDLFRAVSRPSRKSSMGLWGELFLIVNASDPILGLRSWHEDSSERYDFLLDDQIIEVKATGTRQRAHYFSFEQAYPPSRSTALVASIFVEPATGGKTLGELWSDARELAGQDFDLRLTVDRVCIETLGKNWKSARDDSYNWELARESLRYFDLNKIPKVSELQPAGVTEIAFKSNVDLIEPVKPSEYSKMGGLFHALIQL